MNKTQAQQIQSFLQVAANSRSGGLLPNDETQPIADWYQSVLESVHCINLVLSGDADIAWDSDNQQPIFALTSQGYQNADPDLRERATHKNAIN